MGLRQQLDAHTAQHLSTHTLAECGILADRLALFTLFEKVGRLRLLQLARFVSYVETPAGFALTREVTLNLTLTLTLTPTLRLPDMRFFSSRCDCSVVVQL